MNDIDGVLDRKLDDLLRTSFDGPVADDGFSARVMQALPPRREHRRWLVPGAAAAGSLIAWLALMPSPLWRQVAQEWLAGNPGGATLGVAALVFGLGLVACAWSLEET